VRTLHVGIRSSLSALWARALLTAEIDAREPMTAIAIMSTMTRRPAETESQMLAVDEGRRSPCQHLQALVG
jgi:hypothetical protein